jgi:hypothetical protein
VVANRNMEDPLPELLLTASELDTVQVHFDWHTLHDGCVTFVVDIVRGKERSAIRFQINLLKLTEAELPRLHIFLRRRHSGLTTPYEMAHTLCWLIDCALFQAHPGWSKSFRDAEVRKLLLCKPKTERNQG